MTAWVYTNSDVQWSLVELLDGINDLNGLARGEMHLIFSFDFS